MDVSWPGAGIVKSQECGLSQGRLSSGSLPECSSSSCPALSKMGKATRKRLSVMFSSRRRDTIFDCYWSSDVCSSDLVLLHGHCHQKALMKMDHEEALLRRLGAELQSPDSGCCGMAGPFGFQKDKFEVSQAVAERSEERRVGKECRSRWWPDH